jgi:peptidyl-prolyl cis-trans isomerase C
MSFSPSLCAALALVLAGCTTAQVQAPTPTPASTPTPTPILIPAATATATAAATTALTNDTPVIQASGLSISKGDFEKMLANDPRWYLANSKPGGMQTLGNDFGRAFALEAEARKQKVDQDPAVQLKIRNYTQQLLANELLISLRKDFLKNESVLRAEYDKSKEGYNQPKVRHILVRVKGSQAALRAGRPELSVQQARAKADMLLAKLNKGADFAALAKAESDDNGSAPAGGDLGYVPKGSMAANFEAAAYALPDGKISDVIQTEFGFHILRVDQRQPMAFDVMKATIANDLAHRKLDAFILNGYTLNTAYFGK